MPLFSTVVIHRGNKGTLKIQTLVTHFRNIKPKSLSVRPMALYFTKFLPGNSDAGSSAQVCELDSVSHCSGAFNFSGTFRPVTPFVFEREYTEMKIEAQEVCWLRHDGQVCHTGPGEDRLAGRVPIPGVQIELRWPCGQCPPTTEEKRRKTGGSAH